MCLYDTWEVLLELHDDVSWSSYFWVAIFYPDTLGANLLL